jgi:hypothetical protein
MATYDNDLRLKEITTGDESGTWGTSTNANLELIAEAFSYGTEASFSSDADATTTIADGLTDPARSLYFKVTSGVSLTATRTLTIAPNDVSKIWIIENATSGSQSINISQGSGANITIPAGDTKVVYSDGAGAGAAFFDAFASLSVVDLKVQDDLTVTGDITGTLATAAQPNITSVGTLTGFTSTGIDDNADATAITIDSSENVGIGVSSPAARIDSQEAFDTVSNILTNGTYAAKFGGNTAVGAAGRAQGIMISGRSGNTRGAAIIAENQSAGNAHDLLFATSSDASAPAERMRIDSSGNVGIGTTSPNASFKTTLSGLFGLRIQSADTNNSALNIGCDTSSGVSFIDSTKTGTGTFLPLRFATNDAERMRIDTSGNVGIGTTSPNQDGFGAESSVLTVKAPTSGGTGALELIGLANSSGDLMSAINFMSYAVTNPAARITALRHTADDEASIAFDTSGAERLRIDKSGYILAGTTSNAAGNKVGQIVAASGIITTEASITTTNGTVDVTVPPGGIMITSQSGYSEDAAIFTYKADGGSQGVFGTGIGNSNWAFGTTSEPAGAQRNKVWVQTTNTLRFKDNGYGARTYQLTILSNSA